MLPLGEVKIDRQVKSLLILFRTNSSIDIWDQNKKDCLNNQNRICFKMFKFFNQINKNFKEKNSKINIDLKIIDSSD